MRHRVAFSRLQRGTDHRILMLRNMVSSLIIHDQISTTLAKAKQVKPLVEKVITWAKKDKKILVRKFLLDLPVTYPQLHSVLVPRYSERPGGYTRLHRLPNHQHDNSPRAILELVDSPKDLTREKLSGLVGREMLVAGGGTEEELVTLIDAIRNGKISMKKCEAVVEGLIAGSDSLLSSKSSSPAAVVKRSPHVKPLLSKSLREDLQKSFRYIPKTLSPNLYKTKIIRDPTDVRKAPLAVPFTRSELCKSFLLRSLEHNLRLLRLRNQQNEFGWDREQDPARFPLLDVIPEYTRPLEGIPLKPGQIPLSTSRISPSFVHPTRKSHRKPNPVTMASGKFKVPVRDQVNPEGYHGLEDHKVGVKEARKGIKNDHNAWEKFEKGGFRGIIS